jgi:hypothetical protein
MRRLLPPLTGALCLALGLPSPVRAQDTGAPPQLAASYRSYTVLAPAEPAGPAATGAAGVTSAAGADPDTPAGSDVPGVPGATAPEGAATTAAVTGTLPGGVAPGQAVGREVRGPNGEDVAEIQDVLIDDSGQVAAVVLDVGGLLGIAERQVAVPVGMLRTATGGDGSWLALGLTEEQLGRLPAYRLEGDSWVRQAPGEP